MKKSKLFTLLSSFSKDEMKRFSKFIASPYFNNERNFKPIFTILSKYHPDFETDKLSEEKLFSKLNPSKTFTEKSALSMRVLFSQLCVLAEKFLAIEGFNKNDSYKNSSLLREMHLKKLFDIFSSAKSGLRTGKSLKPLDYSSLMNTLLVEIEINSWHKYKSKKDLIINFDNFNVMEEALIIFFLLHITEINQRWNKDYNKNSVRSGLSSNFFRHFDFKSFVDSLSNTKAMNSTWIQLIYYSNRIEADNNNEESYDKLKKIFYDNYKYLSLQMKNELLIRLMNYCIFQTRGNRRRFNEDYLKYYMIFVKENLVSMEHEVFGIRQIRNFVRIACRLKKYNEIEKYFKIYGNYISPEIRDDSINYAKASIQFSKNKFRESLEYLSKVCFSIPMMIKDIKMLKLKCFYELCYFDSLKSEVDTYRHFLSKTSLIPESYAEADKIFMICLIKLSKIRECNKPYELNNLKKEIESSLLNDNTKWIIEKINEF